MNDEVLGSSSFYRPAYDFITRLIAYIHIGIDFSSLTNLTKIKSFIFDTIHVELD